MPSASVSRPGARLLRPTHLLFKCTRFINRPVGTPSFDQFPVEQGAEAAFEASAPHAEAGCKCLHPVIVYAVIPGMLSCLSRALLIIASGPCLALWLKVISVSVLAVRSAGEVRNGAASAARRCTALHTELVIVVAW